MKKKMEIKISSDRKASYIYIYTYTHTYIYIYQNFKEMQNLMRTHTHIYNVGIKLH